MHRMMEAVPFLRRIAITAIPTQEGAVIVTDGQKLFSYVDDTESIYLVNNDLVTGLARLNEHVNDYDTIYQPVDAETGEVNSQQQGLGFCPWILRHS